MWLDGGGSCSEEVGGGWYGVGWVVGVGGYDGRDGGGGKRVGGGGGGGGVVVAVVGGGGGWGGGGVCDFVCGRPTMRVVHSWGAGIYLQKNKRI